MKIQGYDSAEISRHIIVDWTLWYGEEEDEIEVSGRLIYSADRLEVETHMEIYDESKLTNAEAQEIVEYVTSRELLNLRR